MAIKLNLVAKTTPLRVLFWMSWVGSVMFFLIVFFVRDFNVSGYSFVNGLVMVLCFTSAFCVRCQPRLAFLGALTLALPIVIYLMLTLINLTFLLIIGKA